MSCRPELDADTAEHLLSGSLAPDDAPPGFAAVAALLAHARPSGDEAAAPGNVDALVAAIHTQPDRAGRLDPRRIPMFTRLLTTKVAAITGAVVLGLSGVAAATGALPAAAQDAAHDALHHVGLNVPDGNSSSANHDDTKGDGQSDDGADPACEVAGSDQQARVASNSDEQCAEPAPVAVAPPSPTATEPGDDQSVDESADPSGEQHGSTDEATEPSDDHSSDQSGSDDQQDVENDHSDSAPPSSADPSDDSDQHGGDSGDESHGDSDGESGDSSDH